MDFVTGLPISTDWKGISYYSIQLMFDALTRRLLMPSHNFPRWEEDLRAEYSNLSPTMTNVPLHQVIVCKTHVLPSLKFWRCAPEEDVPAPGSGRRCLMVKRMSRKLCIIKACPTFLKSSKLSKLANTTMRASQHRYNLRTHCQEILRRPAVAATNVYQLEGHKSQLGWDCLCLPIGSIPITTQS